MRAVEQARQGLTSLADNPTTAGRSSTGAGLTSQAQPQPAFSAGASRAGTSHPSPERPISAPRTRNATQAELQETLARLTAAVRSASNGRNSASRPEQIESVASGLGDMLAKLTHAKQRGACCLRMACVHAAHLSCCRACRRLCILCLCSSQPCFDSYAALAGPMPCTVKRLCGLVHEVPRLQTVYCPVPSAVRHIAKEVTHSRVVGPGPD